MIKMILRVVPWMIALPVSAQSFVNWESPHVSPLDITPDESRLLAVNTADNRLEIFDITSGTAGHVGAVPVGLDPVSVRALDDQFAWVVNHISDTISIVDLTAMNVIQTIDVGDEPADVIFAGSPTRAFVTVSQENQIRIYDPSNPAIPIDVLDIEGEDLRALATDGTRVYAAVFESGNNTTILSQQVVSSPLNPYAGNPNPPPNDGTAFDPPIDGGLTTPPEVSLIVGKDGAGNWLDDNGEDWSAAVPWDLHDHDVAVLDTTTDPVGVSYVTGLMNANMSLGIHPNGDVTVIGTDCTNHIRFEPNVQGIFVRVMAATFATGATTPDALVDLNPHLTYATPTVSQTERDQSIGDPRGIAWHEDDANVVRGFISGMGSNNVIVVDSALNRIGRIEVGQGPTGVRIDTSRDKAYVMNKFDGSISVIDIAGLAETGRVSFFDPTPTIIKNGRPHLYDTHETSGLGQASCASCHIDGRMDQLAWDLGDPTGSVKTFDQVCIGVCEDWHPMKGPMTTQTLFGIIGTEPLHWRADRGGFGQFNGAFQSLMGDDDQLSAGEMDDFEAFVATLTPPPNPFRNMDGSTANSFPNGGDPADGENLFLNALLVVGIATCNACHSVPTGTNGTVIQASALQETQSIKVPQLRNMYEKTGFSQTSSNNNRGFGFIHDGSMDTLFNFLQFPGFTFANVQQQLDVEAFLMSFATDTHAGVGVQTTVVDGTSVPIEQDDLISAMIALADSGAVGLVVKGVQSGEQRGYAYVGGNLFQSDRAAETISPATLLASAATDNELTFTLVPLGSETRIGIDRDEDTFFDRDELDACSNPADAASTPTPEGCTCGPPGDVNCDGVVNLADFATFAGCFGLTAPNATCDAQQFEASDLDADGTVNLTDFATFAQNFGT